MTDQLTKTVERLIQTYEHPLCGLAPLAKHVGALPLWVDWVHFAGLTADGDIVRVDHDIEVGSTVPETDLTGLALALVEGAQSFPELAGLVPSKPAACVSCGTCGGSGRPTITKVISGAEDIRCSCGGLGWSPRDAGDLGLVDP